MNSKSTKFIYMGDPQPSRLEGAEPDYSKWGRLLHMAADRAYAGDGKSLTDMAPGEGLLLLGGDLVNRGTRENRREEWEAFFEAGGDLMDSLKVASPESFYSFDYGCCHFLVLNSQCMGTGQKAAYKYIGNWIRDDLQENDKPATFVVMHHPMYTVGTSFGDDVLARTMQDNYMKLFRKYRVDFILCGHQHLYCRTREMGSAEYPMVQLMGVSGTKYFNGFNLEDMAFVREYESVATVFEVTESEIKLETIDSAGTVIDTYAKAVNPKPKKDCSRCPRFEYCRGQKGSEAAAARLCMEQLESLMAPKLDDGAVLAVKTPVPGAGLRVIAREEFDRMEHQEYEYSLMQRGRLVFERHRGVRLSAILAEEADADSTILVTNKKGVVRALRLAEILQAGRYDENGKLIEEVPAIITDDFRLVYGQRDRGHYNGSRWIRDVAEIEIRS
ncbi:MAG: metallophosphoesterase [Lentihominibacter sp.]